MMNIKNFLKIFKLKTDDYEPNDYNRVLLKKCISSKDYWYTIGQDPTINKFFMSIPVVHLHHHIGITEELYEISQEEYETFSHDMSLGAELANRCRARKEEEHRLYFTPYKNKRTPIVEKFEVPGDRIIVHKDREEND